MTAMDWSTLTANKATNGSIRRWVNSSKVDPEEILAETEDWMAQRFRVRRMQSRETVTLAEGASSIALDTDLPYFLDPIAVRIQGGGRLVFVAEDAIDDIRGEDEDGELSVSEPCYFTIVGSEMLFDVEADDDYTLIVIYYKRPAPLAADNPTNLYTTTYRALFKAVAMGCAYVFLKDETRASSFFSSAEGHLAKAMENDDLVRRGQEFDVRVNY